MFDRRLAVLTLAAILGPGVARGAIQETWITPIVPAVSSAAPTPTPAPAAKGKKKPAPSTKPAVKLPSRPMVAAGDSSFVDLTVGARFPVGESPVSKERIERSMIRLGSGRPFPLTGARPEDKVTRLDATYVIPGTATIGVQLTSVAIERKGPEFEAYLAEIAASAAQADRQQKKETKKAAREVTTATAKAFVGVFDPTGRMKVEPGGPAPADPLDLPLEFTVEGDPLDLHAGGSVSMKLLLNRQPLLNHPVRVSLGSGESKSLQTDASGKVTLSSLAEGRVLLAATVIRRLSKDDKKKSELYKKADWESFTTSLNLEVLPAAAAAPVPSATPTPKPKPKKK